MKNATNATNAGLWTATKIINGFDFSECKPGQWVQLAYSTQRGQYMGTTRQGVQVVRWQGSRLNGESRQFKKVDAKANKPIRAYAKLYGAK